MSIMQFSRFNGGTVEAMTDAARKAKALWLKHGAETFAVNRMHTGPWTGHWLVMITFRDWAAYGKATEGTMSDPEFQKLMGHVLSMARLEGRNIAVGADL
jgi:hypothetical protein